MQHDFFYRPHKRVTIAYQAEHTYKRVPEAAAKAILAAEAGDVVDWPPFHRVEAAHDDRD